jgi:hypothetical protein
MHCQEPCGMDSKQGDVKYKPERLCFMLTIHFLITLLVHE